LSVCIYSRSDTSMCVSNDSNLSPNSLPSGNCCLPAYSTVQASTLESVTPNHETYLASRRLAVSSSCDGITPVRDEESLPESEEQCTTISDHNLILDSSVITEYTSSYAKAIAKAIGTCELLVRFNNIREKLKQSNQPHALKDEHHHLLAKLQTMVLRTRSEKHAKLKDLENPYKQHNCLPKENTEYASLVRDYHYCQQLLRTMNCQL